MPQRPSAEEVLGLQPRRPTAEEVLGIAPRRPSAEEVLGLAPQLPAEDQGFSMRNLRLGVEQLGQKVSDVARSGAEIAGGIATGDFRPAMEAAERLGRGALRTFTTRQFDPVTRTFPRTESQDQPIAAIEQRTAQRREAGPGAEGFRQAAANRARLAAESAKDPSLGGRIARGIPQAIPYVATGILSGGSIPALAATGAVMELDQPERMAGSAALAATPLPVAQVAKASLGAVRKLFGRGAEQIIEAEAAAGARGAVQQTLPGMERAVAEAAGQVPVSVARRAADNIAAAYHVPRAVMASADVSAPFRQGAIFTISNPRMAARATVEMFRAFKTKNFERIANEIAGDADARLGQQFGLHLGTQIKDGLKASEEAFISKYAGKIPIVKQSEQAYVSYLDVMRVQKFAQYKKLVDNAGLSRAETEAGYKAAARWINYATGRGDFGASVDKMMPLLNTFFFAPKYSMSRLNILNPLYYAKNAATPAGRVILKQQAKELFAFASVVGSTMALAKVAGADVTLSPNDSEFGKIRAGRYTYDIGAGMTQAMKLVYRTGADLARLVRGDKAEYGKDATDVSLRYLRSKLAPVPSWFVDAIKRKTYVGKEYSTGAAIRDRVLPIQWNDWIEAAWQDGVGGILATTPGAFGVGVSAYEKDPNSLLQRSQPLMTEYSRAGRSIPEIHKTKGESDEQFNARLTAFGQALSAYGTQLVESEEYRNANVTDKDAALNLLPRRISSALLKQGESWQLQPRVLMSDVRENLELRRELEPDKRR